MFKLALSSAMAGYAAADLNEDFRGVLFGEEDLHATHLEPMWQQFKQEFVSESPIALDSEDAMFTFFSNLDSVIQHNAQEDKTYTRGINRFSAMTHEQFSDYFHLEENQANADQNCSATRASPLTSGSESNSSAPESWNWQNKGGVSPVKDQGSCGSCWTFSTVGCLESAHLIKYGVLATYSEQQLVDCAGAFENYGCNGGLPSHAFEYINYNDGIATEDAYPYYAEDRPCTVEASTYALSVGHSQNITEHDEVELKEAVYAQPVSVAFQVVDGFSDYTSGVYTSSTCGNTAMDVNHAVLAVGYGNDKATGMDYWIVKNSWGTSWGDNGFFKIERGVNMCGIAMCNSYPESVEEISSAAAFWQI